MRPLITMLWGSLLVACAAENRLSASGGEDSGDEPSTLTPDVDTATTDTSQSTVPPHFWSMQATAVVTSGVLDPDSSRVGVRTWSEQAEVLCAYEVPMLSSTDVPLTDPDLTPVAWWAWSLDSAISEQPECASWQAVAFEVGLGPIDPRFGPSLDARYWSDADLYGMYYRQAPTSQLYSIGVAGTSDQLGGTGATVTDAPLPDGVYELHTLILLDLL